MDLGKIKGKGKGKGDFHRWYFTEFKEKQLYHVHLL